MLDKRGFTLIEIIIVLIIMGIQAKLFYANYYNSIQRSYAQAAEENLKAIYTAQLHYSNDHNGTYCGETPTCADSLASLNTNLNLNIIDSGRYNYVCCVYQGDWQCAAASNRAGITCNKNNTITTANIVIRVSSGQPLSVGNPNCVTLVGNFCP